MAITVTIYPARRKLCLPKYRGGYDQLFGCVANVMAPKLQRSFSRRTKIQKTILEKNDWVNMA